MRISIRTTLLIVVTFACFAGGAVSLYEAAQESRLIEIRQQTEKIDRSRCTDFEKRLLKSLVAQEGNDELLNRLMLEDVATPRDKYRSFVSCRLTWYRTFFGNDRTKNHVYVFSNYFDKCGPFIDLIVVVDSNYQLVSWMDPGFRGTFKKAYFIRTNNLVKLCIHADTQNGRNKFEYETQRLAR